MSTTLNLLLWYATRATAVVGILLLTAVVVLGCVVAVRRARRPEVAVTLLRTHRSISLLAFSFLLVHIVTSIVETYVSIDWISALVPFTSGYRTLWVGLGTVAFDLLLAVMITGLLRPWIPPRLFRAVHWATYALWPIGLLHGWRAASVDGGWVGAVSLGCLLVGGAALGYRTVAALRDPRRRALRELGAEPGPRRSLVTTGAGR